MANAERAKKLLLARAVAVKTIAQREAEAKAAVEAAIREAQHEAQRTQRFNGVLISYRYRLRKSTKCLNRRKRKNRFLSDI